MRHLKETATVINQTLIAKEIYSMWLQTGQTAELAVPGQFISVFCKDRSKLLPRPISICETDGSRLRIVYRVVGGGTEEFSTYTTDTKVEIMGPLGNGFTLKDQKPLVIGGGIGIPPMLQLAKQLFGQYGTRPQFVAGYRDELFLREEIEYSSDLFIATEDGSSGTKGTVIDAINANNLQADIIYACGSAPMLRAIKEYAAAKEIEAQISMEERMACGIGACLACVCKTKSIDHHTNVHNKRICKEGPIFDAREVLNDA